MGPFGARDNAQLTEPPSQGDRCLFVFLGTTELGSFSYEPNSYSGFVEGYKEQQKEFEAMD